MTQFDPSMLEPQAKPVALARKARDAIFAYIKDGTTCKGRGSRHRLAYLIDPFSRRISEVFLRIPHGKHISSLIMHERVTFEQHVIPWSIALGAHYVCVDQTPFLHNVDYIPANSFRYGTQRVWTFYGRGVVIGVSVRNGSTAHCSIPHDTFLDEVKFYDGLDHEYKSARYFHPRVLAGTELEQSNE